MNFIETFHFLVLTQTVKMKNIQAGIFAIFLASLLAIGSADYQLVVDETCRFRIATIPHPNPVLCHLYVQCQVDKNYN